MTEFPAGKFDIAVIGAGHAGIEAALAAARLAIPQSAAPERATWSGNWTPWGARWQRPPTNAVSNTAF